VPAAALSLQSIVRHYPGAECPSVDGLTLDVRPGELLALLGPSGAGKTTTLRVVAGYERPDAGRVLLDDVDITTLPPERRDFGMVFQHYALFPHLSVQDNVAFGLAARGVGREERRTRARRALAGVGLGDAGARDVSALSGGEQQRVALARALVLEPRVLLLDEPLSSLDPTLRVATRDELRETLRASHVTALLVTHDQDDAFAIGDRVALMRRGRLLQVGPPETLYDRPASSDVAAFIGRASLVPALRVSGEVLVTLDGITQRAPAAACADCAPHGWLAVLRPEMLSLAPPDDPTTWRGVVATRHFAAGGVVCHIEVDGTSMEVVTADRGVREGDRVGVRLGRMPLALVPDRRRPEEPV
jgi:ABC-type Fe3+/spermidine/putrescine transport system ATPase subunit